MTEKLDPKEIESQLNAFCGTQDYHQFNFLFKNVVATDGAMALADLCGAYWLLELIASHQPKIARKFPARKEFQNWTLKKRPRAGGCIVSCDDGNNGLLAKQTIEYTDFPLHEVGLYCILSQVEDRKVFVILLKNEY